jgi:hypothetical protein
MLSALLEAMYALAMPSFSQRHGFAQSKEIKFREELPEQIRIPIYDILRRTAHPSFLLERMKELFDPYGVDPMPSYVGDISVSKEEDDPSVISFKRTFLGCKWFQVYYLIEDVFAQLRFHEEELADPETEEPRAFPMQQAINDYFQHVGIGWQMVDGEIVRRGNDAFEDTMLNAHKGLCESRPTADGRIHAAIESLSKRPNPDTAGAVSDAISAIECIFSDVTGVKAGQKATLANFIDDPRFFPGSLKNAIGGLWGYACNEGARHGREGVVPDFDDAQFVVAVCAAISTLLNSKNPKQ